MCYRVRSSGTTRSHRPRAKHRQPSRPSPVSPISPNLRPDLSHYLNPFRLTALDITNPLPIQPVRPVPSRPARHCKPRVGVASENSVPPVDHGQSPLLAHQPRPPHAPPTTPRPLGRRRRRGHQTNRAAASGSVAQAKPRSAPRRVAAINSGNQRGRDDVTTHTESRRGSGRATGSAGKGKPGLGLVVATTAATASRKMEPRDAPRAASSSRPDATRAARLHGNALAPPSPPSSSAESARASPMATASLPRPRRCARASRALAPRPHACRGFPRQRIS
ncbi:unnamed protein product [Lampetra planeri]